MNFKLIAILFVLGGASVFCQKLGDDEIPYPKESNISIIAIGPRPEVRYEGEQLAVREEDEYPPGLVFTKGLEEEEVKLRVGFNGPAPFVRVPSNQRLQLSKRVKVHLSETTPFFSLPPIEPGCRALVFLHPTSPAPYFWRTAPEVNVLNLDAEVLANKNIIIKNQTGANLVFLLGDRTLKIDSSGIKALSVDKDKAAYENFVVARADAKDEVLIRTTMSIKPKHLNILVFYLANPKTNRGKRLGFFKTVIPKPHRIKVNEFGEEISPTGFESDEPTNSTTP
jgi:hypothetical protein